MADRIKRTEGGSGGKRGHSSMSHWDRTEEIKRNTKRLRRKQDRAIIREQRDER